MTPHHSEEGRNPLHVSFSRRYWQHWGPHIDPAPFLTARIHCLGPSPSPHASAPSPPTTRAALALDASAARWARSPHQVSPAKPRKGSAWLEEGTWSAWPPERTCFDDLVHEMCASKVACRYTCTCTWTYTYTQDHTSNFKKNKQT